MNRIILTETIIALLLIIISCTFKQKKLSNRSKNEITGFFTSSDAISDTMADSLQCEGIKYGLKINKDTTYTLTFSCADSPYRLLSSESGKWRLIDSGTLKLISTDSNQWLISVQQNNNHLIFLEKNNSKLSYNYQLYRDSTSKE